MRREEAEESHRPPLTEDRAVFGRRPSAPYLDIRPDIRPPVAPVWSGPELDPQAYFTEWQLPDAVPTR